MKKNILAAILAALMLFLFCSCSKSDSQAPDGMVKAESDFIPYTMYVPDTWNIDTTSGFVSAYCPDDNTSVSMMVLTITKAFSSIEEYVNEYTETLKNTYVSFELSEDECIMTGIDMGGLDAARIVYTIKADSRTFKYQQIITGKGYYVYTLTYTALEENYDSHLEDLSNIIKNITF